MTNGGTQEPITKVHQTMAIHHIHITKAGKDVTLEVNDETFDNETFVAIVAEGLKACLNAKMSKVGPVTKLEGKELAEAQADALRIAEGNLVALQTGKFKFAGQKAKTPVKRDVHNEAMRLTRDYIRDQITLSGYKISHIPAKDITASAKNLVETDPMWVAQAEENLANRNKATGDQRIDLAALGLKPDPDKLAKAEAAKVTRKNNLSAKTAGQTKAVAGRATKSKPGTPELGAIIGSGGHATPSQIAH